MCIVERGNSLSRILLYIDLNEWKKYTVGEEAVAFSKTDSEKGYMHIMVAPQEVIDYESIIEEGVPYIKYSLRKYE